MREENHEDIQKIESVRIEMAGDFSRIHNFGNVEKEEENNDWAI